MISLAIGAVIGGLLVGIVLWRVLSAWQDAEREWAADREVIDALLVELADLRPLANLGLKRRAAIDAQSTRKRAERAVGK